MIMVSGGSIIVLIEKTVNGVWWVDILCLFGLTESRIKVTYCALAPPWDLPPPPLIMTVRRGGGGGGGIAGEDQSAGVFDGEGPDRREIITVRGQSYVSRLPKY